MPPDATGWRVLSEDVHAFARFLLGRDVVRLPDIDRAYLYMQEHNPRLGELAQQHGLLSAEEVERVLEHQAASGSPFGQAARDTGLLSGDDLEHLLREQSNVVLHLGHALFALGVLTAEQMVKEMVAFERNPQPGFEEAFTEPAVDDADIPEANLDEPDHRQDRGQDRAA